MSTYSCPLLLLALLSWGRQAPGFFCGPLLLTQSKAAFVSFSVQTNPPKNNPDTSAFTDQSALRLLSDIRQGLEGRMQQKLLGSFDFSRMSDGAVFRSQLVSFYNQYDSVRIYFDLQQTSMEGAKGITLAQVEMEASSTNDNAPVIHKQEQLRFVAENESGIWKFTDVQPRAFFSAN